MHNRRASPGSKVVPHAMTDDELIRGEATIGPTYLPRACGEVDVASIAPQPTEGRCRKATRQASLRMSNPNGTRGETQNTDQPEYSRMRYGRRREHGDLTCGDG